MINKRLNDASHSLLRKKSFNRSVQLCISLNWYPCIFPDFINSEDYLTFETWSFPSEMLVRFAFSSSKRDWCQFAKLFLLRHFLFMQISLCVCSWQSFSAQSKIIWTTLSIPIKIAIQHTATLSIMVLSIATPDIWCYYAECYIFIPILSVVPS